MFADSAEKIKGYEMHLHRQIVHTRYKLKNVFQNVVVMLKKGLQRCRDLHVIVPTNLQSLTHHFTLEHHQ